jgi:hypothetical protein
MLNRHKRLPTDLKICMLIVSFLKMKLIETTSPPLRDRWVVVLLGRFIQIPSSSAIVGRHNPARKLRGPRGKSRFRSASGTSGISLAAWQDRTKVPDKRKPLSFLLSFVALGHNFLVAKVSWGARRRGAGLRSSSWTHDLNARLFASVGDYVE